VTSAPTRSGLLTAGSIDAVELDQVDHRDGDNEDEDGQDGRHGSRLRMSVLALAAPFARDKGVALKPWLA
jgi:hypothetical protein